MIENKLKNNQLTFRGYSIPYAIPAHIGGVKNKWSEDFLGKVYLKIPINHLADKEKCQWILNYLNGSIVTIDGGGMIQ